MDILVFRECPDPMDLVVTMAHLVWLGLLVQEALLVLVAHLVRMVDLAHLVLLDLLDIAVPRDKLVQLDLPELLVPLDPLVQLVADMMFLVAMMSIELTRLLSGLRTMRWMPLSSP